MGYLFVSYSRWDRKNKPIIDQILNDLRAAGITLWLVPDDIPPGVEWQEVITDRLQGADGILYLFGRPLDKTHQIANELSVARSLDLPVFIVIITDRAALVVSELFTDLDQLLFAYPVIDARNDYDERLADLIAQFPESVKPRREIMRGGIAPVAVVESPPEPKSLGYVFISYAEEDSAFVEKLRVFLGEKGYGYWDYQASDRNFHTQLFLELEEVIQNAAATLSVLSPDWKASSWAAKEYLFSEEVGTPVFLLKVRELGPTLVIAGVPYLDFVRDEAGGFARLDRELRRKGLI